MKKVAIALGAALVIAGVVATYLGQELRTQREQNSTAIARVTALENRNSTGSMAAVPVGDGVQAAALIPATAAPNALSGPGATASAGRGQSVSGDADPLAQMIEQMRNSPEGQQLQRMMMRQMLEEQFPSLAKDMNLNPEKAEKLLDLLAKRRAEEAMDILGGERGGKQDRAARADQARIEAERARAYEAELKALLGDRYLGWNEYESAAMDRRREEYTRMGREQMRAAITAGGSPLTDAQFAYLNTALTAEQNRIEQETTSVQQQMQRLPETNRRLVTVAAAHLNPQQLDGFRRYLQQQQEAMSTIDAMGALPDD
jgi:hypothetical protein